MATANYGWNTPTVGGDEDTWGDELNTLAQDVDTKVFAVETTIPNNEETDSYTLVLADAGKRVRMNKASANNLTVPPNADVALPVDTCIDILQYGAGQTTVVAGSGVTIRSSGGKLKLRGQYSMATLQKLGTNEWVLAGDLAS